MTLRRGSRGPKRTARGPKRTAKSRNVCMGQELAMLVMKTLPFLSCVGVASSAGGCNKRGMPDVKPAKRGRGSEPLPKTARAALGALVNDVGEEGAAARLKMSPNTLSRIVAGFPVRRGTAALVNLYLGGTPAA